MSACASGGRRCAGVPQLHVRGLPAACGNDELWCVAAICNSVTQITLGLVTNPLSGVVAAAGLVALLTFGEVTHWWASRRRLGSGTSAGRREVIVVLGYKNRGRRANSMNRSRVRAALRSLDLAAPESMLVFCGGPVSGKRSEAELMEDFARRALGYTGPTELERASTSTWENIQNAIPLIEAADTIKIVSNSLHAEKGRAYLWKLRPDLASRLVRAADYRPGELIFVRPFAAVLGLWNLRELPHTRK